MKQIIIFILIWVAISNSVKANTLINLTGVAQVFHFPESELIVQDISKDDEKINGNGVLSAYRISSKTPFAFYPIVITVAREGTFITDDSKKVLSVFDTAPEGPISQGGRGPFGSLSFGEGIFGGLYMEEIRIPATREPLDRPELRMAIFSAAHIQNMKIDVRVAMLSPFSNGANLVKISGGEAYYEAFAASEEDKNYDEPLPKTPVDLRAMFITLNEVVRKSPLLIEAQNVNSSTTGVDRATPSPSAATPIAQLPAITERQPPIWPWLMGIAAFAIFVLLIWKWRAK